MLPYVYILALTISLKKCQFSRYYLIIYQLQQLALKSVHFHVTICLYTSSNNQPQKVSIFTLLPYYILAPTISLKKCPFSRYYLIIYQLQQLASKSVHFHVTICLYTSSNNQPKKCPFSCYYLIIYQLQQLASKSVHFHVTTLLYTSYNNQPQKVSIFMLLSVFILAPTISLKKLTQSINIFCFKTFSQWIDRLNKQTRTAPLQEAILT